ncbi:MAG TPA: IPT/TIG domain-containing protein, partial [Solirubrobacteraceae bacterium]|nr:IPT/TIG domain-containing protein [Solirubrobacteraceae bacterium]
ALALLEDGTVEAWGANNHGQLGDGTTVEKDSPVVVAGLSGVVAVAAGQQFSLALLGNGEVRAWGSNESGQLGNGTKLDSHTPVVVTGLAEVSALAAGGFHALALLANGEVRSWGADNDGQLGNGVSGTNSDVPVAVGGLGGVTGVAAGRFESFAILSGGQVDGWGSNSAGQLGDGAERTISASPTSLACDLHGIEGIATYDEAAFAWGAAQETCPGIGGVVPSEGPAAGGTEVTITGSEFGSAGAVSFGSTPASSVSFESPTEIKAVAPAGSETVDVRVTNAKGTSAPNLKDHFTYAGLPTVSNVSPDVWRAGQTVEVTGTNLGNATELHFGSIAAPLFRSIGSHAIAVVVPSGGAGVVDVTARNPTGTSVANPGDEFMYETTPEFGRCVKLSGGTYTDKGCSIEGEGATPYNWYPAAFGAHPLVHPGVQVGSGSVTIETPAKLKLACTGISGSGTVTAYDVISLEHLTLTGCSAAKLGGACTSSGASPGEVRAKPVSARLGKGEKAKGVFVPALQWEPASGEVLAAMTCGTHAVTLTGSFVVLTGKQFAMLTSEKLQAKDKKGVPGIAGLQGQPPASLGIQVDSEAVQVAAAKLKAVETNEEAFEIR